MSTSRLNVSVKTLCIHPDWAYSHRVPKLWHQTVEAHRRQVREAILAAAWRLVEQRGLRSVTMAEIADQAGIGRATLYKYFSDVESILVAWHQRHVEGHLAQLVELRDRTGDPGARLEAVLEAYALIRHRSREHGNEIAAMLHRQEHVAELVRQLHDLLRDLVAEAAAAGVVRGDIAAEELASFVLHAAGAAGDVRSEASVRRLVTVTLAGLRPPESERRG